MCDRVRDAQEIGGVDVVRASVEVHLQPCELLVQRCS